MNLGAEVGVGASTAAVFAALVAVGKATALAYRRTIGSRRHIGGLLNRLACGVTRDYVDSLLGQPAFHRRLADGLEEYVYRIPHVWVQVLANRDGDVVRFGITAGDKKFKFSTKRLSFGNLNICLVKDTFAKAGKLEPETGGVRLSIGARRFDYAESHYFGNPGGYQYYVLAYNDAVPAGDADFAALEASGMTSTAVGDLRRADDTSADYITSAYWAIENFRRNSRPNTLIISGPMGENGVLSALPLGVDKDHIRVLQP